MYLKLGHPSFPQYSFYLLQPEAPIREEINRLGPVKQIAATLDWPQKFQGLRGWTDKLNSLWWPGGGDTFSTLVTVLDEPRLVLLARLLAALEGAKDPNDSSQPYVILSAIMAGKETDFGPEMWPPNVAPTTIGDLLPRTLMEWKLYPLQAVNLSAIDPVFFNDGVPGMWLLPLVDTRYFRRNTALNQIICADPYPDFTYDPDNPQCWMPPLRGYPQDAGLPSNYVAITDLKTYPGINGSWRWGDAVNVQASMENWRVVCRDVRSTFNSPLAGAGNQHSSFTGILCDYPIPKPVGPAAEVGYHADALYWHSLLVDNKTATRKGGGPCDYSTLYQSIPDRLQFLFNGATPTSPDTQVILKRNVPYPGASTDFSLVDREMTDSEKEYVPGVHLQTDGSLSVIQMVADAAQWSLIYYLWRRPQAFLKFPCIAPVIPNGHTAAIRWDFSEELWETTYIAVDGVQGLLVPHADSTGTGAQGIKIGGSDGAYNRPNYYHIDYPNISHLDFRPAHHQFAPYGFPGAGAWTFDIDPLDPSHLSLTINDAGFNNPGIVNTSNVQYLGNGTKVVRQLSFPPNPIGVSVGFSMGMDSAFNPYTKAVFTNVDNSHIPPKDGTESGSASLMARSLLVGDENYSYVRYGSFDVSDYTMYSPYYWSLSYTNPLSTSGADVHTTITRWSRVSCSPAAGPNFSLPQNTEVGAFFDLSTGDGGAGSLLRGIESPLFMGFIDQTANAGSTCFGVMQKSFNYDGSGFWRFIAGKSASVGSGTNPLKFLSGLYVGGTLQINLSGPFSDVTGVLSPSNGGTGNTSFTPSKMVGYIPPGPFSSGYIGSVEGARFDANMRVQLAANNTGTRWIGTSVASY